MTDTREAGELERNVVAARAGDDDAFAWLVDRYSALVFATAYGWLGDRARAEEATQDVFARLVHELGSLRNPAALATWLRKVTVKCCDRITRRRTFELAPVGDAAGIPAVIGDPATVVEEAGERERVRLAVESLPVDLRLPIVLHYLAELSTREIATVLDVPESTVKGRIQSAKTRLRSSFDALVSEALATLAPVALPVPTAATRLFLAIRVGDEGLVARLLDADPALVESTEDWAPRLALDGRLPFPNHGTPLLRAVGRGDRGIVRLLLARGASVNHRCECAVGETPLWAAVVHDDPAMVELLLGAGADPNEPAARGQTPADVATQRGSAATVAVLAAGGATTELDDLAGPRPPDHPIGEPSLGAILVTGIRALDLLVPIGRGARVLWEGHAYVGQMALLAEISSNLARRARCRVIWTGVPQGGLDRADVAGEMRETGTQTDVDLLMGRTKGRTEGLEAVDEALAIGSRRRDAGEDVVIVLFVEPGWESCADLLVGQCGAGARGSVTGIVVTTWVESVGPSPLDERSFDGFIALDPELAGRGIYPALDVVRSRTATLLDGRASDEHRRLARTVRDAIVTDDAALAFVRQHFRTREAADGVTGEYSALAETLAAATALVRSTVA